jgi:hypothetical protein
MKRFSMVGVLVISLLLINSTVFAFAPDNQASEKPGQAGQFEQQIDLSGTYRGEVQYPERNLRSGGILTIEGNKFRFLGDTADSEIEGRIVANRTANYIAAVLMFGDAASPTIISVRAVQKHGILMLTSVPWERHAFSFAPHPMLGHGVPEGEKIRRPAQSSSKRRNRKS